MTWCSRCQQTVIARKQERRDAIRKKRIVTTSCSKCNTTLLIEEFDLDKARESV